jgi:hypothetical protein
MQHFNVHGRMVAENDRPGVVSRGGLDFDSTVGAFWGEEGGGSSK